MDYRLQPEHTDRVSASHAPNSYPTTNSHSNDWNHPLSQPYPSSSRTTPGPSAATNFGSFGPSPPRLYPAPYGYTTEPPDEPQELTYTEQLEQQNEQYRDQVHLLTTRVASFEASQHQYMELINKMAQPDRLTAPTPPVRKEDDPAFRQRVLWYERDYDPNVEKALTASGAKGLAFARSDEGFAPTGNQASDITSYCSSFFKSRLSQDVVNAAKSIIDIDVEVQELLWDKLYTQFECLTRCDGRWKVKRAAAYAYSNYRKTRKVKLEDRDDTPMPPSRKPVSNRPQTVAPSSARRVTASGLPSPLTPSPAGHKAVIGGSGPLKLSHRSGSSVPALATTTAGRSSHPAPFTPMPPPVRPSQSRPSPQSSAPRFASPIRQPSAPSPAPSAQYTQPMHPPGYNPPRPRPTRERGLLPASLANSGPPPISPPSPTGTDNSSEDEDEEDIVMSDDVLPVPDDLEDVQFGGEEEEDELVDEPAAKPAEISSVESPTSSSVVAKTGQPPVASPGAMRIDPLKQMFGGPAALPEVPALPAPASPTSSGKRRRTTETGIPDVPPPKRPRRQKAKKAVVPTPVNVYQYYSMKYYEGLANDEARDGTPKKDVFARWNGVRKLPHMKEHWEKAFDAFKASRPLESSSEAA